MKIDEIDFSKTDSEMMEIVYQRARNLIDNYKHPQVNQYIFSASDVTTYTLYAKLRAIMIAQKAHDLELEKHEEDQEMIRQMDDAKDLTAHLVDEADRMEDGE